jgi:hypothetical protein
VGADDEVIDEVDFEDRCCGLDNSCCVAIGLARICDPGYAARGISGVTPYPILRRTERGVPSDEALLGTA